MKAFQFLGPGKGLELRDLPVPKPNTTEALIRVEAAGLCHSDTHVIQGGGAAWMCATPVTLGHEVAGVIVELGESGMLTSEFKIGDRVAVACVGHPIQGRNFKEALGVGCDGGYAEYAVAPTKNLVKIPSEIGFAQAAVATDAIATAYHAVISEGYTNELSTVAIVGLGGLGLNGVAVAAHCGAKVYAIDINPGKFDEALAAGAKECKKSLGSFSDLTFDVVVDFAGTKTTIRDAVSAVRPGGIVVLVGLASQSFELPTTDLVTKNISLKGSTSASIQELQKVFELLASGALKPQIQHIPFHDIPKALEMLGKSEVNGRLYTTP